MTVLIVEDYGHEALLLESLCASVGATTEIASTMRQAMETVVAKIFDLIFLDLNLTDSSPKETIESVPQLKQHAKVVIVTGYATEELRQKSALADGFLSKSDPDYADKVMAQLAALRK